MVICMDLNGLSHQNVTFSHIQFIKQEFQPTVDRDYLDIAAVIVVLLFSKWILPISTEKRTFFKRFETLVLY